MRTRMPVRGLLLACLTLWLTSCASAPPPRIETVTVHEPVIVPVPAVYTHPVPMPMLPARALTNDDISVWALQLIAAVRRANWQIAQIAGLHPPAQAAKP